jgi:DNA adenine methylase
MSRPKKQHEHLPFGFGEVLEKIADEQKPCITTVAARPFLKWVGGKRSVLPELVARLPQSYNVYHEPFLGGGALFFEIQPRKAILSDVNFHLIITFQAVRDNVEELIKQLKVHAESHNPEYFGKAREKLFTEKNSVKIAALFIYLNKTCYNGLYRVNKAGRFNVPIGSYKNPTILDEENLRNVSKLLQGIDIEQSPFTQIDIIKDDFYYLDPPYHKNFDAYDGGRFADAEHEKLSKLCQKIDRAGGKFMLSNSDTDFVRNLYKGYIIDEIKGARMVSCKADQRGKENELIIRNYK